MARSWSSFLGSFMLLLYVLSLTTMRPNIQPVSRDYFVFSVFRDIDIATFCVQTKKFYRTIGLYVCTTGGGDVPRQRSFPIAGETF